jgi:hypothetical protein
MSSPQIPRAFQGITHLGAPVRVFSPWRNAVTYLAIPVLFLALGGLFWRIERSYGTPLPGWLWGGLGLWLLLTAGMVFWHLRRLTWGVIYENGFARSRGGRVSAFRWEDVVRVTMFPVRARYCHRVEAATGDQLTFTGNPDYMGRMVRDRSFRARRQRLGEAYNRGDAVNFGRLSISRGEGVLSGDKVFPWGKVKSISVRAGWAVLSMKDDSFFHAGGANWAIPQIPNLDVLLDVAREEGVDASRDSVTALP